MPYHPLISVVMPCYNLEDPNDFSSIRSVLQQLYPYWELCIADDASTDPRMQVALCHYQQLDSRIRVTFRSENGHISAASNSALALACGEFVALLDQDDLLSEHALFWVADAILRHPDAAIIYSDEDKISVHGELHDPYFKCSFNYDLFLSQNMINHIGVYKRSLLMEIGGFRPGYEGSQDWDLALRCLDKIDETQIIHIPMILYHWRQHDNSMSLNERSKPYVTSSASKALQDHLQRRDIQADIIPVPESSYFRVQYRLPLQLPYVTLIIPTRNGHQLLRSCVNSLRFNTTYPNVRILIIDNGSDEAESLSLLNSWSMVPNIQVIRDPAPFNYSALHNRVVPRIESEIIGLINNDITVINGDWLHEMVSQLLRPGVGIVGARLWFPDDTVQHAGVILGLGGVAGHAHEGFPRSHRGYFGRLMLTQSLSAVTAATLLVRKETYLQVGGLNEQNLAIAFNDVDFCLRVRESGLRIVWTPFANLYHHQSASRGLEDTPEKQARFMREALYIQHKWGNLLLDDPAYSPNLTLDRHDFSLALVPRWQQSVEYHSLF
ncbi:MAG: glycosyltransferase family 2 protein [Magnetococcales bacterium]|nr:glycosyltransferase family 2 protein [Magnetococcales bacterium]MBF0116683.1 glycosyltransferase family 2 protein [Magnetococcales bacterium]